MLNYEQARRNMLDGQLRPNQVTAAAVLAAFAEVPREKFVTENYRNLSYSDENLPIDSANRRFLLNPTLGARLLQALDIKPHELVLVVASGTGYEVALASRMADMVIGLEDDDDMIATSTVLLAELDIGNAEITAGVLSAGVAVEAPFDVILICGGVENLGDTLQQQLSDGGRLAYVSVTDNKIPNNKIIGEARLITRKGGGFATRYLFDAYAEPLQAFAANKSFSL